MTKILFVYYMEPELQENWNDGLKSALSILQTKSYIKTTYLNLFQRVGGVDVNDFDFVLAWGGFNSPADQFCLDTKPNSKVPFGLCIGGNAFPVRKDDTYDVLFYETTWFAPQVKWHPNTHRAFGINSEIFYPHLLSDFSEDTVRESYVLYDYVSAGSFSKWKRYEKLIDKPGNRMCVGQMQSNNMAESMDIAYKLIANGVAVSPQVQPWELALIFNLTDTVYVPASIIGGGERTVWEAMACGCKVEVEPDNPKLQSLLEERVLDEWDYEKQLRKGIESCLKK